MNRYTRYKQNLNKTGRCRQCTRKLGNSPSLSRCRRCLKTARELGAKYRLEARRKAARRRATRRARAGA